MLHKHSPTDVGLYRQSGVVLICFIQIWNQIHIIYANNIMWYCICAYI